MGHYSGNSGLVGKPKNPSSSFQSGIWSITEANLAKQSGTWPADGETFPLTNPPLQWVMSAQVGPATISNGDAVGLSNEYSLTPAYSSTWTADSTVSRSSYTNSSGDTRYYYSMDHGANLRTSSNTSGNSTIISNGGFVWYISMIPYTSTTGWTRPWNYYGLAQGSTVTGPSNTDEYDGPLFFINRGQTKFEYRRPTSNTNAGDPSTNISTFTFGQSQTISVVIRQNGSTASYWLRNSGWNGSSYNSVSNTSMTMGTSGGYGIRTTANSGIPVFADGYYNNTTFNGIMESGFINHPLTTTECNTLVNYLDDKYG